MNLTERTVREASCPAGKADALIFDDALKGFGLRVTASGRRIFLFQYKTAGKVRRTTIGQWGTELTVAQARRRAEALRGQVREHRDPVAEARATKAATLAAEAKARAARAAGQYTVKRLVEQYAEHHLSARSPAYRARVVRDAEHHLKRWLGESAGSFTHADAVAVLDRVRADSGPVQANRVRAQLRACWGWACKRGALAANPWAATPRPLPRETPRERVLTDWEVGALYRVAGAMPHSQGVMVRLLILTGQRRSEIAELEWREVDLAGAALDLPASRTKNHMPHSVPLVPTAVELLESVPKPEGTVYVFEGSAKTPFSGFGRLKARLAKALAKAAAEAEVRVEPWTLHDLRRTAATGLQRLGIRLEVTEAVLNHISGSRAGIVGVYQRHGWAAEKRAALEAWASHVLALVS